MYARFKREFRQKLCVSSDLDDLVEMKLPELRIAPRIAPGPECRMYFITVL